MLAAAGLAAAIGGTAAVRWWYRWMFVDSDEPPAPDDLVLLVEPDNDMEAEVMRSKLDSFGIPALVKNTNALSYYRANWVPMLELHVRYRDVRQARELLGLEEPAG